jgi:hypothetical protein
LETLGSGEEFTGKLRREGIVVDGRVMSIQGRGIYATEGLLQQSIRRVTAGSTAV